MIDISIIHPSRGRAKLACKTAIEWVNRASGKYDFEYILSLDRNDSTCDVYRKELLSTHVLSNINLPIKIIYNNNKSAIDAVNVGAKESMGNLLIVVSDDFTEPPVNWDEWLMSYTKYYIDFLIKTDDGLQPWIITLPIMDRAYYNRFGYVYYPGYKHMFADTEMTHVGDLLNRTIRVPVKIPHNHYTTGKTKQDNINLKNDDTWGQGEELYLQRMERNFDLINPPGVLRCDKSHIDWLAFKGYEIFPGQ